MLKLILTRSKLMTKRIGRLALSASAFKAANASKRSLLMGITLKQTYLLLVSLVINVLIKGAEIVDRRHAKQERNAAKRMEKGT